MRGFPFIMTDEELRIRSYLQAQAAKLSPAEVIDKVRAAMAEVRRAAMAIPPDQFERRPAPDEWSGNDVMAHVIAAGRRFGNRITQVLDGVPSGDPISEPTDEATTRRTADAWCTALARDRDTLFAKALGADPTAGLDATIEHPMFGPLNWRETLLFMRIHDLDHAGQLRKIVAALGIASRA